MESYIDSNVKIGKNVKIHPFVFIKGESTIGDNSEIFPFTYIENSLIGSDCKIIQSHILDSEVKNNVTIGPFARLRPKSLVLDNCKIGNFVEIKNSTLFEGVKASHLAYIGDSEVGRDTNIGCGVIFANYNGRIKQKIKVGKNCFIGSNCNLIAPLVVKDNCYICAGSTVTKDLEENDFVIARSRETIKKNRAKDYLKEENI